MHILISAVAETYGVGLEGLGLGLQS